jgi:hypothetical protein
VAGAKQRNLASAAAAGTIIGAFERLPDGARSETAYRALFRVLTCVLIAAVAVYSCSRDVRPSEEMRGRAA